MIRLLGTPNGGMLPRRQWHCKQCFGMLRAARAGKDWMIVCDTCEIAAVAPASQNDAIEHFLSLDFSPEVSDHYADN